MTYKIENDLYTRMVFSQIRTQMNRTQRSQLI
jgi:hypothetical protein